MQHQYHSLEIDLYEDRVLSRKSSIDMVGLYPLNLTSTTLIEDYLLDPINNKEGKTLHRALRK